MAIWRVYRNLGRADTRRGVADRILAVCRPGLAGFANALDGLHAKSCKLWPGLAMLWAVCMQVLPMSDWVCECSRRFASRVWPGLSGSGNALSGLQIRVWPGLAGFGNALGGLPIRVCDPVWVI